MGEAVLQSLLNFVRGDRAAVRLACCHRHVIVVLHAKATGGFRPIGLFPSVVRIWMRVRLADTIPWQSMYERPWLYASAGKGAEVAAWKQAARSEHAVARGWAYAAILLHLVKAFERVPHDMPGRHAVALGYNLHLLKVFLSAYRLPRTLLLERVCSRLVVATRGITAGAGHAVVELRLLLSDFWDQVHKLPRGV